jgi:hypothetical protein
MKTCIVCHHSHTSHSKLCPRCQLIRNSRHDHALKPEDMIAAYDPASDTFRCALSGTSMDESNPQSPYHYSTDHWVPGEKKVVMCCSLFNLMKSSMTGPEIIKVTPHLDDVLQGLAEFQRDIIPFERWNWTDPPTVPAFRPDRALGIVNVDRCRICPHKPLLHSYYCARCRALVFQHGQAAPRVEAFQDAYYEPLDTFLCHYTRQPLVSTGRYGPWHISIDHLKPGDEKHVVVAALWVNRMKTYLTEAQFRAVIHALAAHIRTGAPFDRSVLSDESFRAHVRKVGGGNPMVVRRL